MTVSRDPRVSAEAAQDVGSALHRLAARLFPICRSLTGNGVRETLSILQEFIPLKVFEVPSGTKVFDWTVPNEWNIRDAYIQDDQGRKIIDFKKSNLHVVGYSTPIDRWVSLEELQEHLHSLENLPEAIPYVTSYYREYWGFCLPHRDRLALRDGKYRVVIDSDLKPGHLTYGELLIPGETEAEIFLSTYVCHPSMANNELSGPVLATFLAQWLMERPRRYSYRIVFIPETIGSLVYLSRHLDELKRKVVSGFVLSCLGDERGYSYVASRYGNTLADSVAEHVLSFRHPGYTKYSFLLRGSDERQYCAPGVDLPFVVLCRSKFVFYPEYHTSLDDLSLVTPNGLSSSMALIMDCLDALEANRTYRNAYLCEPQLGKRGLYPSVSDSSTQKAAETMMDFLAYADGKNDLFQIGKIIHKPVWEIAPIARRLFDAGVIVVAQPD